MAKPEQGLNPLGTLRGFKEPEPSASLLQSRCVTIKAEFRPGGARAGLAVDTAPLASSDILEIEFSEGHRLWMRADDYRKRFLGVAPREAGEGEVLAVPGELGLLPGGMQSRGPVKWAVASLKVLGIDLAGKTATAIGQSFDKSRDKGVQRCVMSSGAFRLDPLTREEVAKLSTDNPYLLFIHGTASSTKGSFGELWSEARAAELAVLRKCYGDRVLAFEHGTLSVSPIQNALEIARQLPAGANLHVVSHSRGGLVGELLCRGNRVSPVTKSRKGMKGNGVERDREPFTADELQLFDGNEWLDQLDFLDQLQKQLQKKRFHIERFVRVACPALGTTLASGRLDRWLSVMGSLAGRLGPGTPLFEMFADLGEFAAAVIQERTDPATLPGLAAQMPDSPIIKLLNWPSITVPGDLTVIAGDIEPDAWWAKLLVFITDRFYDGDHDLVVNTPSMYGGAKRSGRALVGFHKGPGVNHFSYFSNTSSARQLVQALTSESQEGFEACEKPVKEIARGPVSRGTGPQPVVFVLPGIMGSELAVGKDPVWADIPDLIFGGLRKLRIDAANVRPVQPMARYYGEIIEYLSQAHKVIPFPYDWRLPVEKEADRLAVEVRREFEEARRSGQPVRLLAHSMGGLVARAMIARHDGLWRDIGADQGGRLVMLGTPNGGSHAITELLVGQSSTLRSLGFLDLRHSHQELLEIISRFPGVLAMLPKDAHEDYFSAATWRDYHAKSESRGTNAWVVPADEDLERASAFRRLLDAAPVDPARMVYIAGSADITVAGMRYNAAEERIEMLGTVRGDGRVTWDSGILPGIPVYYMEVEHGNLAAHEESFGAIAELLEQGVTTRLPQTAPISRAAEEIFPMPRGVEDLYPDQESLVAAALGAGARSRRTRKRREAPVRVKVVHGNLAFAKYPVAVGHYSGDTIVSAERYLDRALGGELSKRSQLGLYPGPIETSAFFINPRLRDNADAKPQGALIVGLGTPISLTASTLTRSYTRALLEYVSAWTEHKRMLGIESLDGADAIGLTALLIGTGAGGVSLPDSVYALLRAVTSANQVLAASKRDERIRDIEIIELWEDVAIQAAKCLLRLQDDPELKGVFRPADTLESSKGRQRRASYQEPPDWWQRLQVLAGDEGHADGGVLRFTATARRARSEVRLLPTQRLLVDRFVEEAIRTTVDNRTVSRTLFELLLPNELKEQAPEQDDLVVLLDEGSARYPWELLEDPKGNEGPFAVRHGLLRQLASQTFREGVRHTLGDTALVVGDPASKFAPLPGAQREALAVARALEMDGHFSVTALIKPDSQQVVNALFDRPYRVIHLAGHGVYQYVSAEGNKCKVCGQSLAGLSCPEHGQNVTRHTGMVLGDGVFLTAMEVRQMREVPELVFINCCHLGRIEPDSKGDLNERRDFHLIAANLATEFIRTGVRAVIAAGWAVDDAAADTFARTLYTQLLSGERFGNAVKAARKETYDRHARTNTWGAYQCYGDPDYFLIRSRESRRPAKPETLVSAAEVVSEIDIVAAQLSTKAEEQVTWELDRLEDLVEVLEKRDWLNSAGASTALARAYGEAYRFQTAIEYYRRAQKGGDTSLTLKDIEQLANYLGRHAVAAWKEARVAEAKGISGAGPTKALPKVEIDEALALIDWLAGPEASSPAMGARRRGARTATPSDRSSPERLSLRASAFKRLAWISQRPGDALEKMLAAYEEADDLSRKAGKTDPYPLLNALFARLVLRWTRGASVTQPARGRRRRGRMAAAQEFGTAKDELAAQIREAKNLVSSKSTSANFWDAVMPIDLALLEMLAGAKIDDTKSQGLVNRYLDVRRLASAREFASVIDQMEFLETMAVAAKKNEIARFLGDVRQKLEQQS